VKRILGQKLNRLLPDFLEDFIMWLVLSDFGLYYEGRTAWDAADAYFKVSSPSCGLEIRETGDAKQVFVVLPSYYRNREKKLFEFPKDFSDSAIQNYTGLIARLKMYMSDALNVRLVGVKS
jgi:hypothetical protein